MADLIDLYHNLTDIIDSKPTPVTKTDLGDLIEPLYQCLDRSERLSEDPSTWKVESPWHAAILATLYQSFHASGVPLDERFTKEKAEEIVAAGEVPAKNLAFRGEADYKRKLCPSKFRSLSHTRGSVVALSYFIPLLKYVTKDLIRNILPDKYYRCTAQHFGIPTEFLDWTTDPTIGASFANDTNSPKNPAVIYIASLPDLERASFLIPPAWMRRIYEQRGIFMDISDPGILEAASNRMTRILFEHDPSFQYRKGRDHSHLYRLKDDQWIQDLADWCKRKARNGVKKWSNRPSKKAVKALFRGFGQDIPSYLARSNAEELAEIWLESGYDLIMRSCILDTNDGTKLVPKNLELFCRDNELFMSSLALWCDAQDKPDPHFYNEIAQAIRQYNST